MQFSIGLCTFIDILSENNLPDTLWCLIEDARLVFGITWIFLGVLVLQSSFSVKRLPCLVFHPGFQLFLFAIQHDDVTVTSKVECHVC